MSSTTNPWSASFFEDLDYDGSGAWSLEHAEFAEYLAETPSAHDYPINLYDALRAAYILFGRSRAWMEHARMTPEIAAALGAKAITKAAKGKQQHLSEYRRVLLAVLDDPTTVITPATLSKALRLTLKIGGSS